MLAFVSAMCASRDSGVRGVGGAQRGPSECVPFCNAEADCGCHVRTCAHGSLLGFVGKWCGACVDASLKALRCGAGLGALEVGR